MIEDGCNMRGVSWLGNLTAICLHAATLSQRPADGGYFALTSLLPPVQKVIYLCHWLTSHSSSRVNQKSGVSTVNH